MKSVWSMKKYALRTLKEYSKLFFPYCLFGNMQVVWVTSEESIDKYEIVFWKVIAKTCRDFLLEEHCKKLFNLTGIFLKLGFTPCKAEQPLQGMELQEKETVKD